MTPPARPAPGSVAAFFDLDRTLLSGSSAEIYDEALRDVGYLPEREVPGERLALRLVDRVGETTPGMLASRGLARRAKGRRRSAMREAGQLAVANLLGLIHPHGLRLLAHHRRNGRRTVLTTSHPFDLVEPFASELGFDALVATQLSGEDGLLDGGIVGDYVWGSGKVRAVRRWAAENDVDLEGSWAYADSFADASLLGAVGHPTAVNPEPRLAALALVRRWPVIWLDVPPGVPKVAGIEPQRLAMTLIRRELFPWVRLDVSGTELVPREGAAILVGNHRSYLDPLAVGLALARVGRPVRFLAKKELFDTAIVGDVVRALGGICVDRGSGSEAPLLAAEDALRAGEIVALMPQGTIPRGHEFFDPELKGRWGAARLAHATGAPVIPFGLWGTEKAWPRNRRLPDVLNVLHPPRVSVTVGEPVELGFDDLEKDTRRIMAAISALLPDEAHEWHEPTEEELARTYPPGAAP